MPKRKKAGITGQGQERGIPAFSVKNPKPDAPPELKTVSSEDVTEELKGIGRGWSEDIPGLLSLPPRLFVRKTDEGSVYSRDLRFGITGIISDIDSGEVRARGTDYGIAIRTSGSGVYFILADMSRRIIVREKLFSIHDRPPERDWKEVKGKIEAALKMAEAEKEGAAVSDGILRKVKISAP